VHFQRGVGLDSAGGEHAQATGAAPRRRADGNIHLLPQFGQPSPTSLGRQQDSLLNRPGIPGDSDSRENWGHATILEVLA